MQNANQPSKDHIQGILLKGYSKYPHVFYVMLQIEDPAKCKSWLGETTFQHMTSEMAEFPLNIAFTSKGLTKLGIQNLEERGFSRAFVEGMDTDHRRRTLGDVGENNPDDWKWGGREKKEIHLMLMLFGKEREALKQVFEEQKTVWQQSGMNFLLELEGNFIENKDKGHVEHFGFRDGISQPEIRELGHPKRIRRFEEAGKLDHLLNPGEFVLGYKNAYDKLPHSPSFPEAGADVAKGGSYMVFRQIEQDVKCFWETLHEYVEKDDSHYTQTIALAAKMMGRHPDGRPLIPLARNAQNDWNDFRFHHEDPKGQMCPFGAHIRRSNPRDTLSSKGKTKSIEGAIEVSNKHRILRRGRTYGNPVVEGMNIEEVIRASLEGSIQGERGLHFICFNTDIQRQFEFVQHSWSNNRKFAGRYQEVDPIIGVMVKAKGDGMEKSEFEVPAYPVRKRYRSLPPFVQTRGGAYFFLPSIPFIQFLSQNPTS
ncbi:MAG: Dyp-type peroxidase [Bacteroidota bacterium]